MKRLYLISEYEGDCCIGLVSDSVKNAKSIGSKLFFDLDFIDIRVKWKRNIDISDYPLGYIFGESDKRLMEGLKIGVYDYLEFGTCLQCGYEGHVNHSDIKPHAVCLDCYDNQSLNG